MNDSDEAQPAGRDAGSTLVEILISIILLGMVVTAVLATLGTTVNASRLDRDHVNAHAWLQTASDILYGSPREDCGTQLVSRAAEVRAAYEAIVRETTNPEGWPAEQIEVASPVLFWDGEDEYQTTCFDDDLVTLQKITIQVRSADGDIVESVEVVKG